MSSVLLNSLPLFFLRAPLCAHSANPLQDGARVCIPLRLPAATAGATGSAPTQADLLDFARRTAADTELIASLPLDPEGRTWARLEGPGGSEAWLIGWPPGTGTGWHDHADSVGAFLTAAGELKEYSLAARLPTDGWKTLELTEGVDRERRLPADRAAPSAATTCTRC